MDTLNAIEVLHHVRAKIPKLSIDDMATSVLASINTATPQETSAVLRSALQEPDLFIKLAKSTPTAAIDFLSVAPYQSSLWGEIIDAMVDQVVTKGANNASPIFSLVRRWSHLQSTHCINPSVHSHAVVYWETIRALALHPKGEEFVKAVRSTKGPVRQWMDDFHYDVANGECVENQTILNHFLFDLPPTAASNALWLWRIDKTYRLSDTIDWGKMGLSSLSAESLAKLIYKNQVHQIQKEIIENIFSWQNPVEVIIETKKLFSEHIKKHFTESLISTHLNFPLSQNVWTNLSKNPMAFFTAMDAQEYSSNLLKEYSLSAPRGVPKSKVTDCLVGFASKLWMDVSQRSYDKNDIWSDFTVVLHTVGLLPHVVLNTLKQSIANEHIRWTNVEIANPEAAAWKIFRHPAAKVSPNVLSLDHQRFGFIKLLCSDPIACQILIEHNPTLCPKELTFEQQHKCAKKMCGHIQWNDHPIEKIVWMSEFFKNIDCSMTGADIRSILLAEFKNHFEISNDELPTVLTENSETAQLLQDVLRHSSSNFFPYTGSHERMYAQTIEKFLLLEAANYTHHAFPNKRKI